MFEHRPPWWPENEAWPPIRGHMRRNPFFRRLGCAFAVFNIFGLTIFFLAAVWVANLIGLTRLPANLSPWVFLGGLVLLLLTVLVIILGVFGLRRVFNPLDDLLEAAGRVADGDYAARVPERGSPEVRSLARAFNNMASRLNVTDEMRRNLQADVTHELRTPLTVIRGNLEGMLDGIYPPDETNLRALLDETNFLSRLIEDLRTVALAESGALKLKKEPTDLVMLVRDTLTAFQSQADAAGVKLTVETPDETNQPQETRFIANLELDPVRMRQVLSNLVANALRYTPAGGYVHVKCGSVQDQALLEVTDDGPGIAPEDLPHVFERFYKSTDSGGMGLGLAIARHLVSAHGGSIEAHSASGQGTTIRILLPVN
jgi:signal transduction histidine kinase